MVKDLFDEVPAALADVIKEALETNDFELLRGIQCYSKATKWTHLQGMESMINILFRKTYNMKKKSSEKKEILLSNETDYRRMGIYDVWKEDVDRLKEGKLSFEELKNSCKDLKSRKKFLDNINKLEEYGFIDTDRTSRWDGSYIWLPDRYWEGIIDDAIYRGKDNSVYSSELGKMIAFACRENPVSTLKVIVRAINLADGQKIPEGQLKEKYLESGLSERKFINFRDRDASKNEDIRAIVDDDGEILTFNREMVRVNNRWLERARERFNERHT